MIITFFRKLKFLLSLLLLGTSFSFAQLSSEEELDSFKLVMAMPDDTIKIKAILNMANFSSSLNALKFAHAGLVLSNKLGFEKGVFGSWQHIGNINYTMGNYPEALNAYTTEISLIEKSGKTKSLAGPYGGVGNVMLVQGQFKKAIEYYEKGLKILETLGESELHRQTIFYLNIGGVYLEMKDYNTAEKWFLTTEKLLEKTGKEPYSSGDTYTGLGEIYLARQEYNKAREYFLKGNACYEQINMMPRIALTQNNLGQIELKQKKFGQAVIHFRNAIEKAEKENIQEVLKQAYLGLSEAYIELGNYKEGLEFFKLYTNAKDSIFNESNSQIILEMETKYHTDQKEKEIELLNKNQELSDAENKKQTLIITGVGIGLGLVVLFTVFLLNRFHVIRKQKAIIEIQKEEVEAKNEVIEEKNKEITDSIQYAKRIQNAILPPSKFVLSYLPESFILYRPKDIVAGDFYWIEIVNGRILFAACDCTGHGVPGALVSVICNNALNRSVREYGLTDPGKILDKTREIVISEFEKSDDDVKDGMDISLCSLSMADLTLDWAGANNPLWILRKAMGQIEELKPDKQPIGRYAEAKAFKTHRVKLQKDDSIYIFTDGFQDQFGGANLPRGKAGGKKFKASELKNLLSSITGQRMDKQKTLVDEAFETWRGKLEQIDDVCVIGVRI